jgi:MFS family permease
MEAKARRGSIDFIPMAILAVLAVLVLSMIVTWLLAGHYSLPDDDAIALGLLGAGIVLLVALVLLVFLAGSKLLEERLKAAALQGSAILGLGLLIAPVAGVLPWSIRWVLNSSPWVPFLLRAFLAVWMIAALVQTRKLPPGKSRYFLLSSPTLLAYLIILEDDSVPHHLKAAMELLLFAGLIWRGLAALKLRRAGASTAGPA